VTDNPKLREAKRVYRGNRKAVACGTAVCWVLFSIHPVNLWDTVVAMCVSWTPERKAFSYNKRTMDRAMGPFSPLWHFLESITYVLST
jgi:hypothetical protein